MKPTSKGKIPAKSKPCENKKAKGSKDKSKPKKEPKKPKGKSRSGGSKPQKSAGSTNTTPYGEAKTKFAAEYLPYLLYLSFFCWCLRVTRPISRCRSNPYPSTSPTTCCQGAERSNRISRCEPSRLCGKHLLSELPSWQECPRRR